MCKESFQIQLNTEDGITKGGGTGGGKGGRKTEKVQETEQRRMGWDAYVRDSARKRMGMGAMRGESSPPADPRLGHG